MLNTESLRQRTLCFLAEIAILKENFCLTRTVFQFLKRKQSRARKIPVAGSSSPA